MARYDYKWRGDEEDGILAMRRYMYVQRVAANRCGFSYAMYGIR